MHPCLYAVLFLYVCTKIECKEDYASTYAIGFMHMGSRGQALIGQSKILVTSYGKAIFKTLKTKNYTRTWHLGAKHMWKYDFDPFKERAMKYGEVETKGCLVVSEQDVCVHGLNVDFLTYGGFRAEKLTPQATEFYIPAYSVKSGNSVYSIIAAEDDTHVNISYRNSTSGEYMKPLNITLDKYQIYQQHKYSHDLTGTYITSDKPVAIYSGVDCGQVPVGTNWCDNMVVGVPPVANLGTQFVLAPLQDRKNTTGYVFRVIAIEENTSVRLIDDYDEDIDRDAVLGRGAYMDINYNSSITARVECSSPCMVIQYNKGNKVDDIKTDPFMLLVPPTEEYSNKVIWSIPEDRHGLPMYSFVNVVVPEGKEDGVLLNEYKLTKEWKRVPGGGFSTVTFWVNAGPHTMRHTDSAVNIGVMVYGHGIHEALAYGYPACPAGSRFLPDEKSNKLLYQMLCLLGGLLLGLLLTLAIIAVIWRSKKLKGLAGFSFGKFDEKGDKKVEVDNTGHIVFKQDSGVQMTDA